MFEWLKANPVLYLRGMAGYKDVQSRNSLWADKAAEMGSTVKQLKDTWYKSVRIRVGRLMKKKSGGPQFDVESCSDREKHLIDKMQFLISNIHEVKKRPTVSVSTVIVTVKTNIPTNDLRTVIIKPKQTREYMSFAYDRRVDEVGTHATPQNIRLRNTYAAATP